MGSVTYNFLANSLLFDDNLLSNNFAYLSDGVLEKELQSYRKYCEDHATELFSEVDSQTSSLVVLSDEPLDTVVLTQSALYVNQYLLHDPLHEFPNHPDETSRVMNQYLGMRERDCLDRRELVSALKQMKQLTPMVAAGFLKFLPLKHHKSQDKGLPIYHSDNYFEDVLPQEVLRLFKEAAVVKTMKRVQQGFVIEKSLYPARAINIGFKGHRDQRDFMYLLWQQELKHIDKDTGLFEGCLSLPDTVPELDYFKSWVKQSVNQAAAALFSRAKENLYTAAKLNAVVVSQSNLIFKAVQKVYKPHTSVPMRTANVFLNLELPFLSGVGIDDLMRLRQDEGEAFRRFRLLLDQKLGGIRAADGSDEANREAAMALHELTEMRMEELDSKLAGVKDKLVSNTILAVAGFAAAVQTGGISLLASAQGVASISKTLVDYRADVKRNPAFFLWKTLRKKL